LICLREVASALSKSIKFEKGESSLHIEFSINLRVVGFILLEACMDIHRGVVESLKFVEIIEMF
jgi:hypothetical protein